ncbi:tetratricopeptide repeat protein [Streptomyces xantholiticus]
MERAGEHGEAEHLHRQNVADRLRVLGPDHPDTLTSRRAFERVSIAPRSSLRRIRHWSRRVRRSNT